MDRSKKILFVIAKLGKGGAQTIVLDLANSLVDAGYVVDILLFYRTPQDRTYVEWLDGRVTLVYLTAAPVMISSDFSRVSQRVVQYLKIPFLSLLWVLKGRLDKYDIVHSHLLGASFFSWFLDGLCRLTRKHSPAWVETFHADFTTQGVAKMRLFRFFWKHLDALVMELAHSEFQEIAVALPKTDVRYIPLGVSTPGAASRQDIDTFLDQVGVTSATSVVVTITRLNIVEKRVDRLIEVMAAVKAKHGADFICLFCGDGPDADTLKAYARELGLENQIKFIGYVDDITLPLGAARTFIVGGIEDLVGIAGIQAAGLGIPVVSWQLDPTWKGPRRFFWSDHSTDLVAEELCLLLDDDAYHQTAALRGQQLANEHFSVEAMVQAYVGVYNDALLPQKDLHFAE